MANLDAFDRADALSRALNEYGAAKVKQNRVEAGLQNAWVDVCCFFKLPTDWSPGQSDRTFRRSDAEFQLSCITPPTTLPPERRSLAVIDPKFELAGVLTRAKRAGLKLSPVQRSHLAAARKQQHAARRI